MGMRKWSNDILLVDLPQEEPSMGDELKTVISKVRDRGDIDVLIDFSNVDVLDQRKKPQGLSRIELILVVAGLAASAFLAVLRLVLDNLLYLIFYSIPFFLCNFDSFFHDIILNKINGSF